MDADMLSALQSGAKLKKTAPVAPKDHLKEMYLAEKAEKEAKQRAREGGAPEPAAGGGGGGGDDERVQQLTQEKNQMQVKIGELQKAVEDAKTAHKAEADDLRSQVETLKASAGGGGDAGDSAKVGELEAEIQALKAQAQAAPSGGGDNSAEVAELKAEIESLKSAASSAPAPSGGSDNSAELAELKSKVQSLQSDNSDLKSKLASASSSAPAADNSAEISSLKAEVRELETKNRELRSKSGSGDDVKVKRLEDHVSDLERKVKSLEGDLSRAKSGPNVDSAAMEVKVLKRQNEELKLRLREMENEVGSPSSGRRGRSPSPMGTGSPMGNSPVSGRDNYTVRRTRAMYRKIQEAAIDRNGSVTMQTKTANSPRGYTYA